MTARPHRLRSGLLALWLLLCAWGQAHAVPDTMAQRVLACTSCHGSEDRDTAAGLVPRIAGKPAGYLLEQMRHFRDGRRQHDGMARLLARLDDRYLADMAGHFASLPVRRPAAPPPAVDDALRQQALRWVAQGDASRGLPACRACHGPALAGVAPNVPGLLGLSAPYLAAQLNAWRLGLRHARAPDCMARIARALPVEDIPAIARWLAAQPLPADAAASLTPPATWPLDCGSISR